MDAQDLHSTERGRVSFDAPHAAGSSARTANMGDDDYWHHEHNAMDPAAAEYASITSAGTEAESAEVILETESPHRRKSSMTVTSNLRPTVSRSGTSCFVHGLLQHDVGSYHSPVKEDKQVSQKQDKDPLHEREGPGDVNSRLLTKKELSDLAFSIRELSKRLGRFKMKVKVRNVFLLTKAHDNTLIGLTREVSQWLLENPGNYTIWVENTLKDDKAFDAKGLVEQHHSFKDRLKYWNDELCRKHPRTFDIILALGGDGTVLYSSWLFQRVVPPVISFSLGSLGFLTKFDYGSFKATLTDTFEHGLTVSLRLRLEATVMRARHRTEDHRSNDLVEELIGDEAEDAHTHKPEQTYEILNDVVMDRGPNPTMSSIEVFGDNYHITTIQADGVCIATPTGSTAYNLAAGGSLCHPDNPVVLVTAICAHTLSFRPIIIPDTVVLRLGVPYDARGDSWASFDGKVRVKIEPGDYVTVSASRYPFPTVLPLGKGSEDWIDSLSGTLNWNSRKRQKAFTDGK